MPRIKLSFDQVSKLPQTYSETIPSVYLDDMGHMNVRWYTHLFSEGSLGFMREIGLHWDQIMAEDGGTFVLESHTRFLSEVLVGQQVQLHARVVSRSAKRYQLLLFMVNVDKQDVSAVNEVIVAHVNLSKRKQANLPVGVSENLDRLLSSHENLDWPAPVCGIMKA